MFFVSFALPLVTIKSLGGLGTWYRIWEGPRASRGTSTLPDSLTIVTADLAVIPGCTRLLSVFLAPRRFDDRMGWTTIPLPLL